MKPTPIDDADDPRVAVYRDVRDRDLLRESLFMAEGRLVVRTLLETDPSRAHSVLVTQAALSSLADVLATLDERTPVYLASQRVMDAITGFHIHRGCLAAARRGTPMDAPALIGSMPASACVVVLEDVANHDNVGSVFRSATAFGAGGVLLTERSCDPLYRKAVRVSMGGVLRVPFALVDSGVEAARLLNEAGFQTIALTPAPDAQDIAAIEPARRVALFLGAEGPGLSEETMAACARRVRIATTGLVDSLNLGSAAAIALHRLCAHPVRLGP